MIRLGPIRAQYLYRELAEHLPLWLYYACSISLLVVSLNHLSPPRPEIAWVTVFPLSWVAIYFALHIVKDSDTRPRSAVTACVGLMLIGVTLAVYSLARPFQMDYHQIRVSSEITTYIWTAAILGHIWKTRGREDLLVFFVVSGLYGVILENGGILYGYFREDASVVYLPMLVAPLPTMLGWIIVFYTAIFIVEQFRKWLPFLKDRFLLNGLLVALVAVSLDLPIDPVATEVGIWRWAATLPIPFLGVPLINWFAWVYAVFPFGAVYFYLKYRSNAADSSTECSWNRSKLKRFVMAVPFICVIDSALFFGTFAIIEGGWDGPTLSIVRTFLSNVGG